MKDAMEYIYIYILKVLNIYIYFFWGIWMGWKIISCAWEYPFPRPRSRNLKHVLPPPSPLPPRDEKYGSLEKFIKTTGRIFDGKFRRNFETRSWMESWKVAALRILFQRGARRFTPSRNSLRVKISHGPLAESHVARNFFLNRLSNIPFHVQLLFPHRDSRWPSEC